MFDIFGKRFFKAVEACAARQLGADHACVNAAERVVQTGEHSDLEHARACLAALPDDQSAALMAAVHKVMREDPAAILGAWEGPGGRGPERAH